MPPVVAFEACKICVGCITRERPLLLAKLLGSFSKLRLADALNVHFIIIENGPRETLTELIHSFNKEVAPRPVRYEFEPRLGISFARNRVLSIALRERFDFVAFVDDDEIVDENWLTGLLWAAQNRHLDLVGGPVRLLANRDAKSRPEAQLWKSLARRYSRVERRADRRSGLGQLNETTIITNNWLARASFLRSHELCFDETLGFSGGEDTKLYYAAIALGARTGWAKNAVVSEFVGRERLTFRYQTQRARDQAIASFRTKNERFSIWRAMRVIGFIIYRGAASLALLLPSIVRPDLFSVDLARSIGTTVGSLLALCGGKSTHYEHIDSAEALSGISMSETN